MKYLHFLGIDIGKKTLFCCLRRNNEVLLKEEIENTTHKISQFFKKISQQVELPFLLVCAEHTGIYGMHLLKFLQEKQIALWMESGIQIKLSSGIHREKNDKVDAYRISDYAFTHQLKAKLYQPPREVITRLQALANTRERLLKIKGQITATLTEQAAFLNKETFKILEKSTKDALHGVLKSIKETDKQIHDMIQNDDQLKEQLKLITSIPGVGEVTATKIMIYTQEFKKISCPKKFACYAGTAPFGNQSGTSIKSKPKVSSFAHKKIKSLLHLCALSNIAAKNDNVFKDFYQRKVAQGKNKMSVINALRNKLIQVIFAVVRTNKPFDVNYQY